MSPDDAKANESAIRQLEGLSKEPEHYQVPPAPSVKPQEKPPEPKPVDRRSRRQYRFRLEYTDVEDKLWEGDFLSVMPSIGTNIEIQKRMAKMRQCDGDLPQQAETAIFALCFTDACLQERPDWAKDLANLPEQELFDALAQEVHAHLTAFQLRRQRKV